MSDDLRRRFVWYELMTSDPGAAIEFYTRLVGGDRIVQCADPQGAVFALHSLAQAG